MTSTVIKMNAKLYLPFNLSILLALQVNKERTAQWVVQIFIF